MIETSARSFTHHHGVAILASTVLRPKGRLGSAVASGLYTAGLVANNFTALDPLDFIVCVVIHCVAFFIAYCLDFPPRPLVS